MACVSPRGLRHCWWNELWLLSLRFMVLVFFFSSRRRHTRLQGDWSSDVCSSDLVKCIRPSCLTSKISSFLLISTYIPAFLVIARESFRQLVTQVLTVGQFRVKRKIGRASCRERV